MYDSKFNVKYGLCATFVVLGLLIGDLRAQDKSKIDSLTNLTTELEGKDLAEILMPLAIELYDIDNGLAFQYANRASDIGYSIGDSAIIVKAGRIRGQLLRRLDNLDESIKALLVVHPIAKRLRMKDELKKILNALAIAYTFKANYDEALKFNYESLLIREEDGNKQEISIALNNVGLVYLKMKNHPKALEFFERSLAMKRDANLTSDIEAILENIGYCYNALGQFEKARDYFLQAFKVCGDGCSDQIKMEVWFGLGQSYFQMKKYEESKENIAKSYEVATKTKNNRWQAENLLLLSKIHVIRHESNEALARLAETESIAGGSGYKEILVETYQQFATLYSDLKEFEKASHYQKNYINLKDSIYSEELISQLTKIQTNYAERENLKTIASKDEVIERQRMLTLAIVIIAILATLLIFVLFRTNAVRKRVNKALSEAKSIIEDQNQKLLQSNTHLNRELHDANIELHKANESLLRVNDELDNFIYKTSHDIRGPLASLKGMCNVALMDVTDPIALTYLKKLDMTADKLNTILTRLLIVNQINSSAIAQDRIDFEGIINDVLMLENKKGLPTRLKIRKHIDKSIEYYSDKEFIRIIFENLIDNAIKFYNDSERVEPFVDIRVVLEEKYVKIRVIDNGIGITEAHPEKIFQMFSRASERSETGGIGLYITKTAAEKLGGSVDLLTSPEGYTEFFVRLPLDTSKVLV